MSQIWAFLLILSVSKSAHAYLDPGTGSIIIQGLIAGVAIGWLALKNYYYKILSIFGKKKPTNLLDENVENAEEGKKEDPAE